jgi:hypothetical protein
MLKDLFHFGLRQKLRKLAPKPGRFEDARDILTKPPFLDEEPMKKFDRHKPPGEGGGFKAPIFLAEEELDNFIPLHAGKIRNFFPGQEISILRKVLPVGFDRIDGKPLLHGEVTQKLL